MSGDTIFALSSGAPPAAIAVVRISGPEALSVAERVSGIVPPFRQLALRKITDPDTGEMLDSGLVACFPADGSVSGEAMAELHLHGGRATVDAVLAMLARQRGLRAARQGEFTFRAFANGKLDLVEVESLSDLLRAETETQRRAAIAEGGLSAKVEAWRRDILLLSALFEAALDQSDEDDVPVDRTRIDQLGSQLVQGIGELLTRPGTETLFDGVKVVFAGPPNSGKSTLINSLAQRDVAIVSPIPGTTRDAIEAPVKLGGIAFVLTDTAGIRADSDDAIEREGIARAKQRIDEADIVIWMADEPVPGPLKPKAIAIFPRCDIRSDPPADRLTVSAANGEGIASLIGQIIDKAKYILPFENEVALNRRQRVALSRCHHEIGQALTFEDDLLSGEHMRLARQTLDQLTGRSGTEDMLDALFGTFCIGK